MTEEHEGKGLRDAEREMKEAARAVFAAVTNRETQRHFIRAGMEIMLGFDALLRSMPMPDAAKSIVEKGSEYMDFLGKEICAVNPNCRHREQGGDELEKIDIS